jgi:alkylhydroperoxidase family enzyme
VTDAQMRDLQSFRTSPHFTDEERAVLEYAEAMTRTPVRVPGELFARLRRHFNEAQMVEITAAIAWENFRARFNHAFEIDGAGFSEGQPGVELDGFTKPCRP